MAALASFPLETSLVAFSCGAPPRSASCSSLTCRQQQTPCSFSFPIQTLSPNGFPLCSSGSPSTGLSLFQARAASSEESNVNEYQTMQYGSFGAEGLELSQEPERLPSEAGLSSSDKAEAMSTSAPSSNDESQPEALSSKDDFAVLPSRKESQLATEGGYQKTKRVQNAFSKALAYKNLKTSKISSDLKAKDAVKEPLIASETQEIRAARGDMQDAAALISLKEPSIFLEDQEAVGEVSQDSIYLSSLKEPFISSETREIRAVRENWQDAASLLSKTEASSSSIDLKSSLDSQAPSVSDLQDVRSDKPDDGSTLTDPLKGSQAKALAAFRKAKAYKQQAEEMVSAIQEDGLEPKASGTLDDKTLEVEIITRDGVIKRRVAKPGKTYVNVKEFKKVGMDFVGLDFAEKKKKYKTPAGLSAEVIAPPPEGLPKVEIITRDAGALTTQNEESGEELYKPKVATWGVFPRPANISKTYGGGRIIKPGEQLESEDERKVREAKTQQLLAEYRRRQGLDVDPVVKAKCEEMLKQGTDLMDKGKLRDALGCFEAIMEQITFKSELHGLAALQGAVCLDSLNRLNEAKSIYEKLVSHPNQAVRKGARQFLFSFQAMENLKFSGTYDWDPKAYSKYFEAFSVGYNSYNTLYKAPKSEINENPDLGQTWPYVLVLFFPLVLVFILVLIKGS